MNLDSWNTVPLQALSWAYWEEKNILSPKALSEWKLLASISGVQEAELHTLLCLSQRETGDSTLNTHAQDFPASMALYC